MDDLYAIRTYEILIEVFEKLGEELQPAIDVLNELRNKLLNTDDEVLEEIKEQSPQEQKELIETILLYKKIRKRWEPP